MGLLKGCTKNAAMVALALTAAIGISTYSSTSEACMCGPEGPNSTTTGFTVVAPVIVIAPIPSPNIPPIDQRNFFDTGWSANIGYFGVMRIDNVQVQNPPAYVGPVANVQLLTDISDEGLAAEFGTKVISANELNPVTLLPVSTMIYSDFADPFAQGSVYQIVRANLPDHTVVVNVYMGQINWETGVFSPVAMIAVGTGTWN